MVLIPEALWEALKEQFWETDWPNFRDWLFKKPLTWIITLSILVLVVHKIVRGIAGVFR